MNVLKQHMPREWTLEEVVSLTPEGCKLTPISIGDRRRYSKEKSVATVNCICACGKEKNVVIIHFIKGWSMSCGCSRNKPIKWERSNRDINNVYSAMMGRCNKPKHPSFRYYGAIGVRVCDEWTNNYQKFFDWCMANGWERGLELDKDKMSPTKPGLLYSPEFCCFLTRRENLAEKSNAIFVEYNGEMKMLVEVCEIIGISYKKMYNRMFKRKQQIRTLDEAMKINLIKTV